MSIKMKRAFPGIFGIAGTRTICILSCASMYIYCPWMNLIKGRNGEGQRIWNVQTVSRYIITLCSLALNLSNLSLFLVLNISHRGQSWFGGTSMFPSSGNGSVWCTYSVYIRICLPVTNWVHSRSVLDWLTTDSGGMFIVHLRNALISTGIPIFLMISAPIYIRTANSRVCGNLTFPRRTMDSIHLWLSLISLRAAGSWTTNSTTPWEVYVHAHSLTLDTNSCFDWNSWISLRLWSRMGRSALDWALRFRHKAGGMFRGVDHVGAGRWSYVLLNVDVHLSGSYFFLICQLTGFGRGHLSMWG